MQAMSVEIRLIARYQRLFSHVFQNGRNREIAFSKFNLCTKNIKNNTRDQSYSKFPRGSSYKVKIDNPGLREIKLDFLSFKCNLVNSIKNRYISTSSKLYHDDEDLKNRPESVRVVFIEKDGTKKEVMGKVGERAMYLAHRKGVDMEGACEASLACTTCHCYVDSSDEHWDILPEATEKEEDLLDMAPFLDVSSRLGCQIILEPELDGIVLRLPRATKNFYVDGHKPEPH